ncbi:MAG: hypothetical protein IMZ47_03185 [Firmicutes bacterium]|nr:hypothetical protein [Bacillota bacterium]
MSDLQIEVPEEVTTAVQKFCSLSKSAREGKSRSAAWVTYSIGMLCEKLFKEGCSKEMLEKMVEQLFLDGGLPLMEVTSIVRAMMQMIVHDREIAEWFNKYS